MIDRAAPLNAATVVVVTLGVGAAAWLLRPLPAWSPPELRLVRSETSSTPAPTPSLPRERLAELCRRPLQRPLFDAPPEPTPPAAPPARPNLQLVATALGADAAYAIVRRPDGVTVLLREGELVENYRITLIERGRAELIQGEDTIVLQVPWYTQIAGQLP